MGSITIFKDLKKNVNLMRKQRRNHKREMVSKKITKWQFEHKKMQYLK